MLHSQGKRGAERTKGAFLGGRPMRTTDPLYNQSPLDDEPAPQALEPGESFGPGFGGDQGDTDAWLRQTGLIQLDNSQAAGAYGGSVMHNGANSAPPRWQASRRSGPRVSRRALLVGAG